MMPYTSPNVSHGKHAVVVNPAGETFSIPPKALMCIAAGNMACTAVNSSVAISIVGAVALQVVPLVCKSVGVSTGVWVAVYD